jgi:hypothetical protein
MNSPNVAPVGGEKACTTRSINTLYGIQNQLFHMVPKSEYNRFYRWDDVTLLCPTFSTNSTKTMKNITLQIRLGKKTSSRDTNVTEAYFSNVMMVWVHQESGSPAHGQVLLGFMDHTSVKSTDLFAPGVA